MDTEHPAKKIRFLLHTYSRTIQQLADELGVPKDVLREIVDEEAVPTPHLLHRICGIFNLKEDYFGDALRTRIPEPKPLHGIPEPAFETSQIRTVAAGPRKARKIDLAELAARHQALLECLISKKVLVPRDYQRRLDALRGKIAERRKAARTR